MNKYVKYGLYGGGALVVGGGIVYGYQSYRIAKNLEYRPEINFPQSRLSLDKLTLAIDLVLTNSTPNALSLTKPTLTVRYGTGDTATKFTSIPSNEKFTLSGMGQIRIPNIPIEIIFSDLASIGFDILDKLKKCQEVMLYVDVATQVDGWVFIAKKDAKVIKFTRDNIPSRLANLIPCNPKTANLTNLLSQGLAPEAAKNVANYQNLLEDYLPQYTDSSAMLNENLNLTAQPNFGKSSADKSTADLIAEANLTRQLQKTPQNDIEQYKQETGQRTAIASDLRTLENVRLAQEVSKYPYDFYELNSELSWISEYNKENHTALTGLGCACNALGII